MNHRVLYLSWRFGSLVENGKVLIVIEKYTSTERFPQWIQCHDVQWRYYNRQPRRAKGSDSSGTIEEPQELHIESIARRFEGGSPFHIYDLQRAECTRKLRPTLGPRLGPHHLIDLIPYSRDVLFISGQAAWWYGHERIIDC